MSTPKGKEIIDSGWKSAGIFDALELSSSKTSLIDPFQDKDLILSNDVEARFKKVTTTLTLNGKRQKIEFP